jgi:tetratricopeptide (TPR) repeat protein
VAQSGIQLVADRYTYVATLPFAVLAAGALGALKPPGLRRAGALAAALAVLLLARRTHAYAGAWHDSWSLWRYTLERDPENSFAYNQLGMLHMGAGDDAAATEMFETAARIDPSFHLAYENRGIMRWRAGDEAGALADWERAIELNALCPIPIVNRGSLRFQGGDYAGALADYERALELKEDQAGTWYMLGSTRYKLGDAPGARRALERCLELTAPGTPLDEGARKFLSTLPR